MLKNYSIEKVKDIIPDYNDGDFLCPKSGAKLASLFGLDRAESQGNESFQFTAPKQPKKSCAILGPPPQKSIPPPCAPAVLFATAVHAFSFVNGQYVKQGKIGAAVLGNHVTKEYKILLYNSKQKQISTARIHRGFVLTVQPCNYVTFYDDQQQNWSLMFDLAKSRPEFCKEVCMARWNSEALSDSLVTQDLVQGEGQAVDVGDTVEVAYSAWLLQNHSLGQVFDSNLGKEKLLRVKLGAGKAQRGWEDGMLGMQKGGQRLLIVPTSMGHGSKGILQHVPANSTLVFDVEIHRVKFSKDRQSQGSVDTFSASPSTPEKNTSQSVTDTDESKVQAPKGKVESVSLTSSGASKSKLISRIAKMGQPMLPFLTGAIPAQPDPSDSETEDTSELICDPSPSHSHSPKPAQMPCSSPSLSYQPDDAQKQEAVLPEANTTQGFGPYSFRQNTYFPTQLDSFAPVFPSQHIPYQTPDITSFLMSDARQHNTEILLAIEKLARRVDQLSCKVDELQKEGHFSFRLSSVSLETNMILHNIQRIIQESMCLKKEVLEKSRNRVVEEQNHKIEKNKRYMEQQHSQTCRLQAEQEKVHLSGESGSSTTQAHLLQQEELNLHQRAEKQKCKQMEDIIQNMDEEMQDLRAEKENLDQILSERKRKWQVKRLLNGVFQSLRTEFDSQESYSGHTVLEILQNTIKSITVKLLSEPRELESGIDEDKAEDEYLSTEECLQIKNMEKENNEIAGKGQH
ncbi:FK506-binding protein 15 isoform X2 [Cyprinus carpio]|uniref:peptidylprolyl isomerase n=1 Tax=Cyprinus carpio TaxID=7962 RepID=A0A9Q9WB15_CYPCA|nr:FK506-binding protein 15 isoform X2 [Cyprinus carpio]